ncbi:MAG: ABC transporter permease [Sphaerobacteraceae bacterium]|nr:MAG: ABC transporter permease [Sphaerobacteraceae bacterium]
MGTLVLHSRALTLRHLRELLRQPWGLAIALMQPVIWLLLFGSLFQDALTMPGIGIDDFRAYLTPGIVIMTAIFTAGWAGMGVIDDIRGGVMDRLLVTPTSRSALISGRLIHQSIEVLIQSGIVVSLGLLFGFRTDLTGLLVLVLSAVLIAWAVGAASIGFALVTRDRFAMIGVNMIILPLMLLSTAFMHPDLMPGWISTVATVNPVDWAIGGSREALGSSPDWTLVLIRIGALGVLAAVASWFSVRSINSYGRSM